MRHACGVFVVLFVFSSPVSLLLVAAEATPQALPVSGGAVSAAKQKQKGTAAGDEGSGKGLSLR